MVDISVDFRDLPEGSGRNVSYPTESIDFPEEGPPGAGAIERALDIVATAPQFDQFSASQIEDALGNGLYAVVSGPQSTVWATNPDFNPRLNISRRNPPFTAGDLLPPGDGGRSGTWEVMDWPTGGPSFENKSGMRIQVDTNEIEDRLGPSLPPEEDRQRDDEPRPVDLGVPATQLGDDPPETMRIDPLPRGITESDIVGIGNMLSDQGIPREVWGPMTVGDVPAETKWLRVGAEELRVSARARMAADDPDEAGLFYRVAGLLLQASARDE